MPKIEKISWGEVKINGKKFHQVLIIGNRVLERDSDKLHRLFGTTHQVEKSEQQSLLSENPQVILIASGWSGLLEIKGDFKKQIAKMGVELKVVLTPKVVKEYNELILKGKNVNALIHTTC